MDFSDKDSAIKVLTKLALIVSFLFDILYVKLLAKYSVQVNPGKKHELFGDLESYNL